MTWTLSDSGTTAALTIGTETTLATDTNNGTFVLEVDTSNMVNGDLLEIRIYTIALSSNSLTQAWKGTYQHAQINNHKISPPIASDQSIQCTLTQKGGQITITVPASNTIAYGTTGTGQTTGAKCLVVPLGAGTLNSSNTSSIVQMIANATVSTTSFNSSEAVFCTTSTNQFTMNGAPTGRTYTWKILRI